jgi:hypothetical protein
MVISVISDRSDFDPHLPIDQRQFSAAEFEHWTRSIAGTQIIDSSIVATGVPLDATLGTFRLTGIPYDSIARIS